MPHEPPDNLIELLAGLGLATREQVEGVAGRVKRLAGELPLFESVWVDALCQARVLTPFQAAEINAGRGDRLAIGPYVLCGGLSSNGLGEWFVVRQDKRLLRLLRAPCGDASPADVLQQLQGLIQDLHGLDHPGTSPPVEAGIHNQECWVACEQTEGVCAADWLAHNGRLSPAAVAEIARQMASALAALESRGRLHTDLSARQLILTRSGKAVLPLPGVRAILRPAEGYTRLDLQPDGYDYLAPERISAGTAPNMASEMFACGCLWWHLLCGRPPLSGGDALGKVRSAQQGRISDLRRFAPDAPQSLVEAIAACTQFNPDRRPKSFADLAVLLGPAEKAGRVALATGLTPAVARSTIRRQRTPANSTGSGVLPAAVAVIVFVAAALAWLGRPTALPLAEIPGPIDSNAKSPETVLSPAIPGKNASPPPQTDPPTVLVLPAGAVRLTDWKLQPGQTVRSPAGTRTLVAVPAAGLAVDAEDVVLENLDFVLSDTVADNARSQVAVLIRLNVHRAVFRGCSFQGVSGLPVTAIDWPGPDPLPNRQLPTGRISLTDCVFHHLDSGIRLRGAGAMRIELANCLHLGPGVWLALDRAPATDETYLMSLTHCTLRGGRAVLQMPMSNSGGEVNLRAQECVFAPAPGGGVLALFGSQPNDLSLARLHLSGQGSVLSPQAPLACWQPDYGPPLALPDERIEAAGLVRSALGFAGEPSHVPAASRVVRWQAPLVSSDPPGILERPLYLGQSPHDRGIKTRQ